MTPEEAYKALCDLEDEWWTDKEVLHSKADELLCSILASLGYSQLAEKFDSLDIWYA